MKFNIDVVIPKYQEDYEYYGSIEYNEVILKCRRTISEVTISQDTDVIRLSQDQARNLYEHLHKVFN